MCKKHFHPWRKQNSCNHVLPESVESVYDRIIPETVAWCPPTNPGDTEIPTTMPLIAHLKAGFDAKKPTGWHRNEERQARGLDPVTSLAIQLETWERELVWTEILLLSGNPQSSFRHLARAWGRDRAFQTTVTRFVCQRKGNVTRKTSNNKVGPANQADEATITPSVLEMLWDEQWTLSDDEMDSKSPMANKKSSADDSSKNPIDLDPIEPVELDEEV